MSSTFLPVLSASDVQQAAQLIQQANSPHSQLSPEQQRSLQQQLFDIQRRPEAWGLIAPLLESPDPYVQFFGAHTAQVKISRDWDTFPIESSPQLRDFLLNLTGGSVAVRRDKFILRKLFVATTSLALRLVSLPASDPSHWEDWIQSCIAVLSARGAPAEYMLEFLEIAAEEVQRADLLGPNKNRLQQSLNDAVPMVVQAVSTSIDASVAHGYAPQTSLPHPGQLSAALKCLEAWLQVFPANDLTPLLPKLLSLLEPSNSSANGNPDFDETVFVAASDVLQEILSSSALSDGAGSKTLTEPLLLWLETWGGKIVQGTLDTGFADAISHSLCKLLVNLGDHSTQYLATNLASSVLVTPIPSAFPSSLSTSHPSRTRGQLAQTFLRLVLSYTSLPGYYGVDEEESEMTLGFWYLFQEALWSTDYGSEGGADEAVEGTAGLSKAEQELWAVAKAVYAEAVRALRTKVVWPAAPVLSGWTKDAKEKFKVYRRDVGDALINAYYVLRDDMLGFYMSDVMDRINARQDGEGWEEIEGTLHCIMSIQETVPLVENAHFARLFGQEVLGRLPSTGHDRVRLTMVGLLGEYASWFTTLPAHPPGSAGTSLLMNAVAYVVSALREPRLCLSAANALRDLCDANRAALAPHIGAFAELHAGLSGIPDTESSKVLQSIASVIQALPPEEEIPPVEALVNPVVAKLVGALQSSSQLPEEAHAVAIQQLQTLAGVAKGLTRASDSVFALDFSPELQEEEERMQRARDDPRMIKLRETLLGAVRGAIDLWSTDASVSDALSDFIKSITSLPSDTTLLSLPSGPLLELVCIASQRQLTAVWLSLGSMLIIQLDPPAPFMSPMKAQASEESQALVLNILPILLDTALNVLSLPGAMESNPDIVQAFFGCMEQVAMHFISVLYRIPPGALDGLLRCAAGSLALQERYSLVSACTFLSALITQTSSSDSLGDMKDVLIQSYGRTIMAAVLAGFAGVSPRSATPNLVELLSTLVSRYPNESRAWVSEILFSDSFVQSKADHDAKEKFAKALTGPRSTKRMREAAQQFTLVARGLEGSSFGFASVTA